eukprot:CAMPEP_0185589062 /NCGR_PEP_ID=MMETSP0434-20130131/55513_1 /TAXON_ID=626734 ORGANISM="Favella taraikaensis, Strain Fe Narragansett Bay" /NCGR_SAMPLE_ID=MMETSP0434 /ASSEMBLY_ACC=CAM_ASM_000379 /LENGTH=45 /DNA_ID= /DNA_START= /DNA_END= /DNA_ORIENTATION=
MPIRAERQKHNRVLQKRHSVEEDQARDDEATDGVGHVPAEPLDAD